MAIKDEITLENYMNELSDENRIILNELLEKAKLILPNHSITMKYKFPLLDGYGKFGFAIKSGYIALYFHNDKLASAVEKYHKELGAYKLEKESIRYKKASDIPIENILKLIDELFNH